MFSKKGFLVLFCLELGISHSCYYYSWNYYDWEQSEGWEGHFSEEGISYDIMKGKFID